MSTKLKLKTSPALNSALKTAYSSQSRCKEERKWTEHDSYRSIINSLKIFAEENGFDISGIVEFWGKGES